jgi:hypothetical protein
MEKRAEKGGGREGEFPLMFYLFNFNVHVLVADADDAHAGGSINLYMCSARDREI